MNTLDQLATGEVYSVSQLCRETKAVLETNFPEIWVEGELSNLARPSSGHMYFSLKDSSAQVRCAFFRGKNLKLDFKPAEGDQVLIHARVSLYEGRGDFQLIVESMELAGSGALRKAFEALKKKLAAEGLFAAEHKQALPKLPKRIGVITSPTGAAIRDILTTLGRRFPGIPVLIYPTAVQGQQAAMQICKAISLANQRKDCDVLILARGGGSLEDLWPFNEEIVAREIFASEIPIVAGVGHEVDFTIADFVADVRAATPTAAAEVVSPNQIEWLQNLQQYMQRLLKAIEKTFQYKAQQIDWLEKRLQDPRKRLEQQQQQLRLLNNALQQAMLNFLKHALASIKAIDLAIHKHSPQMQIQNYMNKTKMLQQQMQYKLQNKIQTLQNDFGQLVAALEHMSPLATLSRGYSIVSSMDQKQIIYDASKVKVGTKVEARLAHGKLQCTVDQSISE